MLGLIAMWLTTLAVYLSLDCWLRKHAGLTRWPLHAGIVAIAIAWPIVLVLVIVSMSLESAYAP